MSSTRTATSPADVAEVANVPNPASARNVRARGALPEGVPHLSVGERMARGRAARAEVPRSSHADYAPAAHRQDPVALLESQAESRVPELVPIRYGRMLVSPFTFYRGAALLMAADLAATPNAGLHAQLCGDAHLSNFGVFASPDRRLVFDMNDFDETLPGPWEWDVKRLAASFEVAGRENGFSPQAASSDRAGDGRGVSRAMRQFAGMRDVGRVVCPARGRRADGPAAYPDRDSGWRRKRAQIAAKARTKDSMTAFSKLTRTVDGEPRIVVGSATDRPAPRHGGRPGTKPPLRTSSTSCCGDSDGRCRPTGGVLLEEYRLRRHRPQGRRCGQRRHPRLDRAAARPRRPRTRCSCRSRRHSPLCLSRRHRQERVRQPGRTRRRRPAPDAGKPATSSSAGCTSKAASTGSLATSTAAN